MPEKIVQPVIPPVDPVRDFRDTVFDPVQDPHHKLSVSEETIRPLGTDIIISHPGDELLLGSTLDALLIGTGTDRLLLG